MAGLCPLEGREPIWQLAHFGLNGGSGLNSYWLWYPDQGCCHICNLKRDSIVFTDNMSQCQHQTCIMKQLLKTAYHNNGVIIITLSILIINPHRSGNHGTALLNISSSYSWLNNARISVYTITTCTVLLSRPKFTEIV